METREYSWKITGWKAALIWWILVTVAVVPWWIGAVQIVRWMF